MAPWWRGPFLLLRRPGVAAALLAASVVATLPAASAVPFLSSSKNATLHHQIDAGCEWYTGVTVSSILNNTSASGRSGSNEFDDINYPAGVARRTAAATVAAWPIPMLGPPETTLISPELHGPSVGGSLLRYPMFVVYRQSFREHLQLVAGSPQARVWVPDVYADLVGIRAGDDVPIAVLRGFFGEQLTVTLPDVAIYRSLRDQPHQPWWCDLRPYYGRQTFGNIPDPETIFVDLPTFFTLTDFTVSQSTHWIRFPMTDPDLTTDGAALLTQRLDEARPALRAAHDDDVFGQDNEIMVSSRMDTFLARANLVEQSLIRPVAPIAVAGALVGLVVVGAAAAYWVRRRRHELTMLAAHGVGAGALAMKAVAEALPALVVGSAVGLAGAWTLVRWVGPDPAVARAAPVWAAAGAGAALLLAVITVALVAGLASRPLADQVRSHRHGVLRRLPYELLTLAAAPLAWVWLGGEHVTTSEDSTAGAVINVPGRLLVVPILVVAGLTVLLARLTVLFLRRNGRSWTPRGTATFLGWRRIGRQAAMVAILASATSMPVALATYGSVVTGSVRTTVEDEARLLIGTDVVVILREAAAIPPALADRAALVRRVPDLQVAGYGADLLVIDPDTFARAAYWNRSLDGGRSLSDVVAPLRESGSPTPVVAAGKIAGGVQPASIGARTGVPGTPVFGGTVDVSRTGTLPSQRTGYSMLLVSQANAAEFTRRGLEELWIRGDPEQILAEVARAELPIRAIFVAADIHANTLWEPLTYTFAYLTALSLLTGVVTLVGLLLYLEAQTPLRRRAYVLLRRMGIRKGSHRRALLGELATPLVAGLLGGMAMAAGLVVFVGPTFDLNPTSLPNTVISAPYLALGVIGLVTVVVVIAAVAYAQSRIGRASASEVLRDAE